MELNATEIEQRLTDLDDLRQTLASRMRSTAEAIRNAGAVPGETLDVAITDYRGQLDQLSTDLDLVPEPEEPDSTPLWRRINDRLDAYRDGQRASKRLEEVYRLQAPAGMESLLAPVRELLSQTLLRLESAPWRERELIGEIGTDHHTLCRIVRLVERLYDLSDDQWNTEMVHIQSVFGLPLATAIARGRITLDDSIASSN